jgi:anaerobic selenocysteine-containing dehydrogenase
MIKRISFCPLCDCRCPLNLHYGGERLAGVSGAGFLPGGGLCFKGRSLPEILGSPKRLSGPLKRVGPRGSNSWQGIAWEEALELLADKLTFLRGMYGAGALAWDQGYGPIPPHLLRFLNLFGSPNLLSRSHVCSQPRKIAQALTFGGMAAPDVDNSSLIIVWGRDKLSTAQAATHDLLRAVRRGALLIVVDPRQTSLARRAVLWLPLRPGTDGALALGLLHVIIREELYDQDFVRQHCTGFEELAEAAAEFSLHRTAEITGLPAGDIIAAARMYALNRPACIEMGNGLDQHTNSFQSIRAILSLIAVSGNLNIEGGNVLLPPVPLADISRQEAFSSGEMLPIGSKEYPLLCRYKRTVSAPQFIREVLENHPGRPRALVVTKGNPLVTLAQSGLVKKALEQMDFIAVSDFVVTETARWADLVLPAAFACEGWELVLYDPAVNDNFYAGMPPGLLLNAPLPGRSHARTDTEFVFALAEKLGFINEFWGGDVKVSLSERLQPLGLSLEDFRQRNFIQFPRPLKFRDFATPSGKVELSSSIMAKEGYSTVPVFEEPRESPENRPDLLADYPLVLTSRKSRYFVHSAYRWVDKLNRKEPEPLVEIHPDTAARYGIEDGQWVEIASPRGSCRMRARITTAVRAGVVCGVHGWSGEGNINYLTANDQCDPVLSSNPLKSSLCSLKALTS